MPVEAQSVNRTGRAERRNYTESTFTPRLSTGAGAAILSENRNNPYSLQYFPNCVC